MWHEQAHKHALDNVSDRLIIVLPRFHVVHGQVKKNKHVLDISNNRQLLQSDGPCRLNFDLLLKLGAAAVQTPMHLLMLCFAKSVVQTAMGEAAAQRAIYRTVLSATS